MHWRRRQSLLGSIALAVSIASFVGVIVFSEWIHRERNQEPTYGVDRVGLLLEIHSFPFQLGPRDDCGLRLAVWNDGSFVRSADQLRSGRAMRCGRLSASELLALQAFLATNPMTNKTGVVAFGHVASTLIRASHSLEKDEYELPPRWPYGDAAWLGWARPPWEDDLLTQAAPRWRAMLDWLWSRASVPYPRHIVGPSKVPTAMRPSDLELAGSPVH